MMKTRRCAVCGKKNHHDILQQQMCITSGCNNGEEKEE
jgi:hypothetical protein